MDKEKNFLQLKKKVFLTRKCDSSGIFWWRGPLVDRVCSRRRRWWKRKGNPVVAPPTPPTFLQPSLNQLIRGFLAF